jgi:hypothetical protein
MYSIPGLNQITLDRSRQSRQILADVRERRQESWGWVVYRTTYKSDPAFGKAISIINSWIKREVYQDMHTMGLQDADPTPNNELWACHRLTIMEDPERLNGASIRDVRSHFESWVEGQGMRDRWNKYRVCMMIDDEVLELLVNEVPLAEEHKEMHGVRYVEEINTWYVKVIEAFPEADEGDEDYEGWMKCSLYTMVRLWSSMGDATNMVNFWYRIEDGDHGVYSA